MRSLPSPRSGYAVHPHGRGDNRIADVDRASDAGSPPRAWGQWLTFNYNLGARRFTPTGVGTMTTESPTLLRATVHPHGRGDNWGADRGIALAFGSPPRAWGQSDRARLSLERSRFTPTGVGTMLTALDYLWNAVVHPHGRGDNPTTNERVPYHIGSPPRAWGQLPVHDPRAHPKRFTPTGVGTIRSHTRRGRCRPVHPHGRGDNSYVFAHINCVYGSPPRAWGQCSGSADCA